MGEKVIICSVVEKKSSTVWLRKKSSAVWVRKKSSEVWVRKNHLQCG